MNGNGKTPVAFSDAHLHSIGPRLKGGAITLKLLGKHYLSNGKYYLSNGEGSFRFRHPGRRFFRVLDERVQQKFVIHRRGGEIKILSADEAHSDDLTTINGPRGKPKLYSGVKFTSTIGAGEETRTLTEMAAVGRLSEMLEGINSTTPGGEQIWWKVSVDFLRKQQRIGGWRFCLGGTASWLDRCGCRVE